MKRPLHKLLILLVSLMMPAMVGRAQVSPSSLTWDYDELSMKGVSLTCSGSWTAMVIGDHFTAAPLSGSDSKYINIVAGTSNDSYNDYIGCVIISGSGFRYSIGLTQKAMPEQGPPRDNTIANTRVDLSGNWIISRTYTSEDGEEYYDDVVFYNGLGYPEQIVKVGASHAGGRNIVTPVVYDHRMREDAKSYLPYVPSSTTIVEENVPGMISSQRQWYSSNGLSSDSPYAFSEKEYDGLGRVTKEYKPGSTHSRLSSSGNRPVTHEYDCNAAGEVRNLSVDWDGDLVISGYRPAGAFHKITTTDEDSLVTVEFKDPQGNLRLVRRGAEGNWADTYYAYDPIGNLAWVVSPEGSSRLTDSTWLVPAVNDINDSFSAKYCFVYTSDAHGRQLSAKVPGRAVEYFVYNNYGKIERSQDGLLRSEGLWMYWFYDNAERLVGKGAHALAATKPSLSSCDNAVSYTYGTYTGLSEVGFEAISGIVASSEVNQSNPAGLKTGEKLAVIDSTGVVGYLTRAFYYDNESRLVQTVEKDPDGRISRYSTKYDFVGDPITLSEKHGSDELLMFRTYDGRGRLLRDSLVVNGVAVTADSYSFDVLGRPSGAVLAANTSSSLNRSNTYDIQSRIKAMEVTKGYNSIFRYDLFFESAPSGYERYSGDISSMTWRHGMGSSVPLYLEYDNCDRLVSSIGYAGNSYTEQEIAYDKNGNVLSLKRYGTSGSVPISQPSYSYDGNRRSGCSYDANGNVTEDGSGISRSYSKYTDRLSTVWLGDTVRVSYTRLADGTKVKAMREPADTASSSGTGACGFSYEGSFVYALDAEGNRTLESIAFDEGRIHKIGSCYVADYHIRDHLGSVRAVVRNGNIIEEDDYYPYGTKMEKSGLVSQTSPVPNRYLFSSKEDQSIALGSSGLDFGARDYNHASLAWLEPDPLAHKYFNLSPYSYCAGNPILYIDPKGRLTDKYYDEYGKLIYDTKEGNKEFIIKTSNNERPTAEENAISKQEAENTAELIRNGNITGKHMDNVIEIIPKDILKKAWSTIRDSGIGISIDNAREYGGTIETGYKITYLQQSRASMNGDNSVTLHQDENTIALFHSHQSVLGNGNSRSSNFPSPADMLNAGDRFDYLFIPKDNEIIIFNKNGVFAIFKYRK